jgi:hypothetical protein
MALEQAAEKGCFDSFDQPRINNLRACFWRLEAFFRNLLENQWGFAQYREAHRTILTARRMRDRAVTEV